jgi:hypothetical protein
MDDQKERVLHALDQFCDRVESDRRAARRRSNGVLIETAEPKLAAVKTHSDEVNDRRTIHQLIFRQEARSEARLLLVKSSLPP